MFSYRHIFHAGNYADVFKHVVVVSLIKALQRKDSGFCIHDTHAGIGLYNLQSQQAQKNREFNRGVQLLIQAASPPELIQKYLQIVRVVNGGETLAYYPGSPTLARKLMRPQDGMILTELNKLDYETLKQGFARDKQVAVHCQDAWQGLKAFVPPKQKRGLVLIDPPYELKSEVNDMISAFRLAYKKWSTGIYAIWYPIFEDNFDRRIARQLKESSIPKILDVNMRIRDAGDGRRMIGTGMFIINPPWQLDELLKSSIDFLWNALNEDGKGDYSVSWLVPE